MQQKRFDTNEEQTIAAGASDACQIVNQESRKGNFHGIRWNGRIRADNVSGDNEAHGRLILFCLPAAMTLVAADADSDSELEDLSDFIIASEVWSVFGGSTNPIGEGTHYDFDIAPKTSRTCAKDGYIHAMIVSDPSSAKSVIATHGVHAFLTQA